MAGVPVSILFIVSVPVGAIGSGGCTCMSTGSWLMYV